jgi:hypothetical protein
MPSTWLAWPCNPIACIEFVALGVETAHIPSA